MCIYERQFTHVHIYWICWSKSCLHRSNSLFSPSSFPPCVIGKHEIGDMSRSHRLCRWHAWHILPHSHDSRSQKPCTACCLNGQQHGTLWRRRSAMKFWSIAFSDNRVEVKPGENRLLMVGEWRLISVYWVCQFDLHPQEGSSSMSITYNL